MWQKQILFDLLKAAIVGIGQGKPFLMVLEDLHWLDPTGQEFVVSLLKALENHGLFLLMTTRPVFVPDWKQANLFDVNLEPLTENATGVLVEGVLSGKQIDEKALDYITGRTDGIPLYIEELTRMLVEEEFLILENDRYHLNEKADVQDIPMTLQDLLNARLNRLGQAKETAQMASAIGREFNYELLVRSSFRDAASVQNDLDALMDADLVYRQRRVNDESYIFRHALIRDAAYDGMLSRARKDFHGRIANTLKSDFPETLDDNPMEVARHLAGAEENEEASELGIQAIQKQVSLSSNHEAERTGNLVLNWIGDVGDEVTRIEKELVLNNILTPALMSTRGYGGVDVFELNQRSQKLIEQLRQNEHDLDTEKIDEMVHKTEFAIFNYYHAKGERKQARKMADQILDGFKDNPNLRREVGVRPMIGQAYHADGDYHGTVEVLEKVLELYDEEACKGLELEYGYEPRSAAYYFMAQPALWMGYPEKAKEYYRLGYELSKPSNHMTSFLLASVFNAGYGYFIDEKEHTISVAEEVKSYFSEHYEGEIEDFFIFDYLKIFWDWAVGDEVFPEKCIQKFIDSGQAYAVSHFIPSLVSTYLSKGMTDKAVKIMEEALERCENTDEFLDSSHGEKDACSEFIST